MGRFNFLNSKEKKQFFAYLKDQFGIRLAPKDHTLIKGKDNKVFAISGDIARVDLENLRVESVGLYVGTLEEKGVRLSIDGAQLFGKKTEKNIHSLNEKEAYLWFNGEDIPVLSTYSQYVVLNHKKDILGCGKFSRGVIKNFVPKERRFYVKEN